VTTKSTENKNVTVEKQDNRERRNKTETEDVILTFFAKYIVIQLCDINPRNAHFENYALIRIKALI
jgi:hypothetical protein